jgi:hypothetical protein
MLGTTGSSIFGGNSEVIWISVMESKYLPTCKPAYQVSYNVFQELGITTLLVPKFPLSESSWGAMGWISASL